MMVTNWHLHPKADIQLATWNNLTVTVNEDGTRTYHARDGYATLNPFSRMFGGTSKLGTVICAVKFKEKQANQEGSGTTVVRNGEKDGGLGVPASHGGLPGAEFQRAKRRADPDRVGNLHARRLGEIAVNGSDVVRRGYDAARLTLTGVMA